MTQEQAYLVIYWQIAATFLMGLDYFFPDGIREKANECVKRYFQGMQARIDESTNEAKKEFISHVPRVLISLFQIVIGVACFFLSQEVAKYSELFGLLLLIPMTVFIISGFNFAFNKVFDLVQAVGIAAPFRMITTFLVGSPKGPLAAIGFICLCISFYLRYTFA